MRDNEELPPVGRLDDHRTSGILLHVTSLPSRYGIGDLGPTAFRWIDLLAECQQTWWQVLPLGPTGAGNSPYDSSSTFAGNTLLLSPDRLVEEGLVKTSDCCGCGFSESTVDFDSVRRWKDHLIAIAWATFEIVASPEERHAFEVFCNQHKDWLDDYALFSVLKEQSGVTHFLEWPSELVKREKAALDRFRNRLADDLSCCRFGQFLFFRQWNALRRYAEQKGVRLIGDLPFFVSSGSADVWMHPEIFLLDERRHQIASAGVPPDYFSPTGQFWGNPPYRWDVLRSDGYRWWLERLRALLSLVDVVRLDHFRAFVAAWHIPAGAATAEDGAWKAGPGADLFRNIQNALGSLPFIAEDLGLITDDVRELRDQFQLPGMSVLQFAFDGKSNNPFLPTNHIENSVAYTGTHDNNTTRGWYQSLDDEARQVVWKLLNQTPRPVAAVAPEFVRLTWGSKAQLAIAPLQDVLNLGSDARMNVPGSNTGNWMWRCTEEMLAGPELRQLAELTEHSGRSLSD